MLEGMNVLALGVAALSGMALGALWYSPLAFGPAWMAALGKQAEDLGSPLPAMAGSMLACLVSAAAIEVLFVMTGGAGLAAGATLGLLAGVGLVATAMLSDALFSDWGMRLYLIQAGYRVAYLVLMGMVVGAWPR